MRMQDEQQVAIVRTRLMEANILAVKGKRVSQRSFTL